jgi:hypothetical protein
VLSLLLPWTYEGTTGTPVNQLVLDLQGYRLAGVAQLVEAAVRDVLRLSLPDLADSVEHRVFRGEAVTKRCRFDAGRGLQCGVV